MNHDEKIKLLDEADALTMKLDLVMRSKLNKTKQDIQEITDTLRKLVALDCAAGVLRDVQSHLEELQRWDRELGDDETSDKYTH